MPDLELRLVATVGQRWGEVCVLLRAGYGRDDVNRRQGPEAQR